MEKFNVGFYTAEVIGGQTKASYTYYMSLKLLAQRLMKKYDARWLVIDEGGDMWSSWETRAFLDQGGFLAIYEKEKPKWKDRFPVWHNLMLGVITAAFSLLVGWLLLLAENREKDQPYEQPLFSYNLY